MILELLKKKGLRQTQTRISLLQLFGTSCNPKSAMQLLEQMVQSGNRVNKTTVYRELETLLQAGILRELIFADGVKYYELSGEDDHHHHHVVCTQCKRTEDIVLKEEKELMSRLESTISGFTQLHHTLGFFGICKKCSKK